MTVRDPEPVSAVAPDLARRAVIRQHWGGLAFAHWRVEPDRVAPLLPTGTRPDVFDGSAWVGLIPFELSRSAFGPFPPVPVLGTFLETNVRLYSVDDLGRRGVVFRTLEAQKLLPVLAANVGLGLPYRWASMTRRRREGVVEYASRRHGPGPTPSTRLHVRPTDEVVDGDPLAEFLTARWGMHVERAGRTLFWPNRHEAWPLRRAELVDLRDELVADSGLPGVADREPDSLLWSDGVDTVFAPPGGRWVSP
ncbi:YqjF family protein [Frigoribacterium faeni]|uniref:DUF2071 domain-containing protein n=1 Tax=Frigoribacterium faeni TaxID=145483 RepID=A0A7W3JGL8_9MICO|nr:DUF2071 domain-containing protein [Frigoribacterium faeni]MBA8812512.1 hypothetical protein [Frigoribacterium faeni]BFF13605.1 DUF2071 domain-containing protein [Microbacterium flavescens]GEK81771.1 hypothetical protein FFA01_00800 [Frigoribacterium faeni]